MKLKFSVRDDVQLDERMAILINNIAGITTTDGVLQNCELRNDAKGLHLFIPKQTASYDDVIRKFPRATLKQRQQIRAITPVESSRHIRMSLAHAGFDWVGGEFEHGEGITLKRVKVVTTNEGDELYITKPA